MPLFRALLGRGTAFRRLLLPDVRGTYVATRTKAKGTECRRRPCFAGAFPYIDGRSDGGRPSLLWCCAMFRRYSMMKPITATAFMSLVDDGTVGLHDPVHRYIPSFKHLQVPELRLESETETEGEREREREGGREGGRGRDERRRRDVGMYVVCMYVCMDVWVCLYVFTCKT